VSARISGFWQADKDVEQRSVTAARDIFKVEENPARLEQTPRCHLFIGRIWR
jgi:hypothetical protein